MFRILVYLVFFSPFVCANEFYGMRIGGLCDDIRLLEEKSIATPVVARHDNPDEAAYIFRDNYLNHIRTTTLSCKNGFISSQSMHVEFDDFVTGENLYRQIRNQIIDMHGQSCTDYRELPFWKRLLIRTRGGGQAIDDGIVTWQISKTHVGFLYIRRTDPKGVSYSVFEDTAVPIVFEGNVIAVLDGQGACSD